MNWAGWVLIAYCAFNILANGFIQGVKAQTEGGTGAHVFGFAVVAAFYVGLMAITFQVAQV